MKYSSILIFMLIITSVANAKTRCDSEKNGEGKLLSLKKKEVMLKNIQVDDVLLFANMKVKVVDFYVTGGPEEGLTVVSDKGEQFDIWCIDQNTSVDN